MRIALVAEGTYPVHAGGVSTWCQQLFEGLPEHEWTVVALTATHADRPIVPQPESVHRVVLHPLWDAPPRDRRSRGDAQARYATEQALLLLWDAALAPDGDSAVRQARIALQRLTTVADRYPLGAMLDVRGSTTALLSAWRRRGADLPPLSVADAVAAAHLGDRLLAAVDAPLGPVDVVHAAGNGAAALVGLAARWRDGTPLILSEHGVYLRERYLGLDPDDRSWNERRAVTALVRRISEVAYREAFRVLPVSDFNRRWAERLGARPERVVTIRNGVRPDVYAPVGPEPESPTLSFVGRIDPLKDLHTLVRAFSLVRERIPEVRLRLFGPVPVGNEAYRDSVASLAAELGVADAVTFEGPASSSRPAIEAGSIVVLSSISEGLPFSVIEAMMCGRATVNTDVGGVAECIDPEGRSGVVVPARDPEAFAAACVDLLTHPERRRAMAAAARRYALSTATLDRALGEYRTVYELVEQAAASVVSLRTAEIAPLADVVIPRPRDGFLVGGRL